MGKLTESKVLSSARATSLKNVKNLNCWGNDIDDISILKKLPNLEVLNLSVNRISTLKDVSYCPKLKELYLRKNCLTSISELIYLRNLPQLKVVWLSENPCTLVENYRSTVIHNLPSIIKLDNKEVSESERQVAELEGEELLKTSSDLPDFTGLDLSVTLQEDDLAKFLYRNSNGEAIQKKSTRKDIDIHTINEKRAELGLKQLDIEFASSTSKIKESRRPLPGKSKPVTSNAYAATMLLLNELDAEQLQQVIEAAEGLIQTFEVDDDDDDNVDERDAICD